MVNVWRPVGYQVKNYVKSPVSDKVYSHTNGQVWRHVWIRFRNPLGTVWDLRQQTCTHIYKHALKASE